MYSETWQKWLWKINKWDKILHSPSSPSSRLMPFFCCTLSLSCSSSCLRFCATCVVALSSPCPFSLSWLMRAARLLWSACSHLTSASSERAFSSLHTLTCSLGCTCELAMVRLPTMLRLSVSMASRCCPVTWRSLAPSRSTCMMQGWLRESCCEVCTVDSAERRDSRWLLILPFSGCWLVTEATSFSSSLSARRKLSCFLAMLITASCRRDRWPAKSTRK